MQIVYCMLKEKLCQFFSPLSDTLPQNSLPPSPHEHYSSAFYKDTYLKQKLIQAFLRITNIFFLFYVFLLVWFIFDRLKSCKLIFHAYPLPLPRFLVTLRVTRRFMKKKKTRTLTIVGPESQIFNCRVFVHQTGVFPVIRPKHLSPPRHRLSVNKNSSVGVAVNVNR